VGVTVRGVEVTIDALSESASAEPAPVESVPVAPVLDEVRRVPAVEAANAIHAALGWQDIRFFSLGITDSTKTAVSLEQLKSMLKTDQVSEETYIQDTGEYNFDCEDFALLTKANLLQRYHYDGVGLVCTPGEHAFLVALVTVGDLVSAVVIEPQLDPDEGALVVTLTGQYVPDEGVTYEVLL